MQLLFFRLTWTLDKCTGKCLVAGSKGGRRDIDTLAVLDCFASRLGIGSSMYTDYLVNKQAS